MHVVGGAVENVHLASSRPERLGWIALSRSLVMPTLAIEHNVSRCPAAAKPKLGIPTAASKPDVIGPAAAEKLKNGE